MTLILTLLAALHTAVVESIRRVDREDTLASTPTPLEAGWANHFDAFGMGVDAGDDAEARKAALDKIMDDYTNDSVVRLYDHSVDGTPEQKLSTFGPNDLPAIRAMFAGLFPALNGCAQGSEDDKLQAQVDLDEAGKQVFLVWSCSSASFNRATDTFIFDDNGVIINQNIVVAKTSAASRANALVQFVPAPVPVSEAWANHAGAFMAGAAAGGPGPRDEKAMTAAVTKIMLDYDAQSVVRLFQFSNGLNSVGGDFVEHVGLDSIKTMFTDLFKSFTSETAPVVPQALEVDESLVKQVFLIWEAPDSGYAEATDTFIFSDTGKIHRQNIAFLTR